MYHFSFSLPGHDLAPSFAADRPLPESAGWATALVQRRSLQEVVDPDTGDGPPVLPPMIRMSGSPVAVAANNRYLGARARPFVMLRFYWNVYAQ